MFLDAADRRLLLGSCGDVHGVSGQDDSTEKDKDSSALSDATTIPTEDRGLYIGGTSHEKAIDNSKETKVQVRYQASSTRNPC